MMTKKYHYCNVNLEMCEEVRKNETKWVPYNFRWDNGTQS